MLGGAVDRSSGQAKEGRHRTENDERFALLDGVLVQVKEGEFGGCCSVRRVRRCRHEGCCGKTHCKQPR